MNPLKMALDEFNDANQKIAFTEGVLHKRINALSTLEEYRDALATAGRNAGPELLKRWVLGGRLTPPQLRTLLLEVWSGAEYPERFLGTELWVRWFKRANFISDDGRPKPTKPLRVWRGCLPLYRRGMSWTEDPSIAKLFKKRWNNRIRDRYGNRMECGIYTALANPARVLALINAERPGEREVVVDTKGMHIKKV
jgi:hypothetical protein